jgi:PAS domain S-box-containing protein
MKNRVVLAQVSPQLAELFRTRLATATIFREVAEPAEIFVELEQNSPGMEALVLGSSLPEPIRLAQRIQSWDKNLSILILSPPATYHHLKQTLQFSSFLGREISCWSTARAEELVDVLDNAIRETRQRRRYKATLKAMQQQLVTFSSPQLQAKQYLDRLLDYAPIGVVTTDAQGVMLTLNRQAEIILDLGQQTGPGLALPDCFPEFERRRLHQFIAAAHSLPPETFAIHHQDGRILFVEVIVASLQDLADNGGVLVIFQDITERKRLEEQLRHSQKMEAIGQVAGGVAHHFNNMLTALLGYTGFALATLPADHATVSDLRNSQRIAKRVAHLTQQLLAFTRQELIRTQVLNLNDLLLNLKPILDQYLADNIGLVILPDPNLRPVQLDPNQFEQVLLNLVLNAAEAMPEGGQVIIKTANVNFTRPSPNHPEISPGHYVLLTVTDTGLGMSQEVLEHIFEPFFTTKEVGQGTGLGLATCFGIVKQNDGHITVDSQTGQGTTVRVYLPQVK